MTALVQQNIAIGKLRTALQSIASKYVTSRKRQAETLYTMMSSRKTGKERPFLESINLVHFA